MIARIDYLKSLLFGLTLLVVLSVSPLAPAYPAGRDLNQVLLNDHRLAYATYFGGSGSDGAASIAIDSLGNVYVAGTTSSINLQVAPGAFQSLNQGGDSDGFVLKLNPTGTLVYSTYLGGKGRDQIFSIAVDRLGNAYVTGSTDSKDFPTTEGALEGKDRYFTAKLNASASELVYSTRGLGGAAVAVDASGNAYVAGGTNEQDFPTTPGAFQTSFGGGQVDAFVAKLNAKGDALVYSTYLGGWRDEYISAIDVDRDGSAYVAGNFSYYSPPGPKPFPTTPGAYLESLPNHPAAFVTKLDSTGGTLDYSTYVEASWVSGIAIDDHGNAYVAGDATFSTATTNAFQKSSAGVCCYVFGGAYNGGGDAFVMKLNRSGSALDYATYVGGSNYDTARSIAVDSLGNAYVVGHTDSVDFPLSNPLQLASRGVVRSDDSGSSWNAASVGLRVGDAQVLVIDPRSSSTLYAGSQLGLFKSADGGNQWRAINNGLPTIGTVGPLAIYFIRSLVIDPVNSSTVYLILGTDLFKSADSGNSWSLVRKGVNGIVFDPDSASTLYAATDTISKSTDGGFFWSDLTLGLSEVINGVNKVVIAATSPTTIFADLSLRTITPESIGIIKSTDGGVSWRKVGRAPSGGPFGSYPGSSIPLVVDPRTPSTVYAGSLKSTDSGDTWSALNFTGGFINTLAIDPARPSTLYAGTGRYSEGGIYKSTDGGASWILTQVTGSAVYSLAIDSNNSPIVYAGTGITSDAFVTKLDPAGTATIFSTMLGGFGVDGATSVAVDSFGNAYITGGTSSTGLPTPNAIQPTYNGSDDAFVAMIGQPSPLKPRITRASINRKTLVVFGDGFDFGATILIDGAAQSKTENDGNNPTTTLIAQKSAKRIARGQTVKLVVRNSDGAYSPEFSFARQ